MKRGTVIRLRHDVYVGAAYLPEDPRELHLLKAMAEQLIRPELTASHETAALAWGLPFVSDHVAGEEAPTLTLPPGPGHRSRRTPTALILVEPLPPDHVTTTVAGLRVTTMARTAVDIAGSDLPRALIPLDAALAALCRQFPGVRRRRDLANARLRELGQEALVQAMTAPRSAGLVCAIGLADPRRETPIESLSAGHFHLAGIPAPVPQVEIAGPGGVIYPDFLWPEFHLVGEADGAVKYATQQAMLDEKRREQTLRDLGFEIVRWTGKEIWVTPDRVMERVRRALENAG